MGPLSSNPTSSELFRQPLMEMLNPSHPLVKLTDVIDWSAIEQSFGAHFASTRGRPALPPRLIAGLLYPYFQYFTGETYFQTALPIDPSSLTRWRQRIGEDGV